MDGGGRKVCRTGLLLVALFALHINTELHGRICLHACLNNDNRYKHRNALKQIAEVISMCA